MATSTADTQQPLTLYGYFRSSCTARVRIALLFKHIEFEYIPVNLLSGSHLTGEYQKVNPSQAVPTLVLPENGVHITQSIAALEYLEEASPHAPALLPSDLVKKSHVRSLASIIACDVQPVTNMRILKRTDSLGYDRAQWAREFHADGFKAFEAIARSTAGKYCVGDEITIADVCLAPAVWNAERFGLGLDEYPTIKRVYENAASHSAFQEGHWKRQVDCPGNLR